MVPPLHQEVNIKPCVFCFLFQSHLISVLILKQWIGGPCVMWKPVNYHLRIFLVSSTEVSGNLTVLVEWPEGDLISSQIRFCRKEGEKTLNYEPGIERWTHKMNNCWWTRFISSRAKSRTSWSHRTPHTCCSVPAGCVTMPLFARNLATANWKC